ncbi:MAG: cell wall hydrolase [Lachnospiraceae bacterium]|nr:cell wall hydrolase [Lachnospiraceae bacterium]
MKRRWYSALCLVAAVVMAVVGVSANESRQGHRESGVLEEWQHSLNTDITLDISQIISGISELVEEAEADGEVGMCPAFTYPKDWNSNDSYLLARIAMAEAEGESIQAKTLVILTVLNRVQSGEFPDSIEEVIFQCRNGTYQFSCIGNGRWDRVEPNEECWEAVRVVQEAEYDYSGGCLYFENCADEDNWHSRNLEYLYQCDSLRFYR